MEFCSALSRLLLLKQILKRRPRIIRPQTRRSRSLLLPRHPNLIQRALIPRHPSSRSAPSPAACTQTGSPDRNTCTACTNAIQIRTSDTAHRPIRPCSTVPHCVQRETARVPGRLTGFGPNVRSRFGGRQRSTRLLPRPLARLSGRDPDNHAADILPPQTLPKHARVLSPHRTPPRQVRHELHPSAPGDSSRAFERK